MQYSTPPRAMIQSLPHDHVTSTVLIAGHESDFMSRVFRWSWIGFIIATAYQCLFHLDIVNLLANFCVGLGWLFASRVLLQGTLMWKYPLSGFLILAFTATQLYLPLMFTSLEGKPLIYNLELPEQVFFHSLVSLLVMITAHALYRFLIKMSYRRPFPLMTLVGFFTPPRDAQLWLMGIIGLGATYYVYFVSPDIGRGVTEGTALDKLIQGLVPFSYAPYFIPVGKLYGKTSKPSQMLLPMLVAFTIVIFALSIGRNSRGAFMLGFASVGFTYVMGLLLGVFKTRFFTIRNVIFAGAFIWLLTGPLSDLGTAMVIVRGEREEISPEELIDLTLKAFDDKNAIRQRRLEDNSAGLEVDWDERYLDNLFTARFANVKYNDLSLEMASELETSDPDMQNHALDYFLGALPEPLLKAFNFDVDKEFIYSMSVGDYMYLITGGQGFIEGFRTGHFAGTGMATFGWWYLLLLGVGMVPSYLLFDLFFKRIHRVDGSGSLDFQFSLCGLLALFKIWNFLPSESVVSLPIFLVRGWPQLALLYLALFYLTRLLSGVFKINVRWGA